MGFTLATALLKAGYRVTISCRSVDKGEQAVSQLREFGDVNFLTMDMNDLATVRSFAAAYSEPVVHLLVNNAGIMNTPFAKTADGFEAQYQVNHLAHFLLTHLLFPKLVAAGGSRVVSLSSRAHMRHQGSIDYPGLLAETADTYDGWRAYGRSKLCNILFSKALAKRFPLSDCGVAFFSLHPGLVDTGLLTKGGFSSPDAMAPEDGIKCTVFVSTASEVDGQSGEYYHNNVSEFVRGGGHTPNLMAAIALSEGEADECFAQSMQQLGLQDSRFGDC